MFKRRLIYGGTPLLTRQVVVGGILSWLGTLVYASVGSTNRRSMGFESRYHCQKRIGGILREWLEKAIRNDVNIKFFQGEMCPIWVMNLDHDRKLFCC
jgi:hypothetical protein